MRLPPSLCLLAPWLVVAMACSNSQPPTAPTAVVVTTTPVPTPAVPTTPTGVTALTLALPIAAADAFNTAYGLIPYGVHAPSHAEEGHAGWDIECRPGALVRAAADGTVEQVAIDPNDASRAVVLVTHAVGTHLYRTIYTNLASLDPAMANGAVVLRGQPLGFAATDSRTISGSIVTYASTHFQLDDLDYYFPIRDSNAVNPLPFLTADARTAFDRIFTTAAYEQELSEPYASNPRTESFPLTRTWRRDSGSGPMGISFTRASARSAAYTYAILAESGVAIEGGTVTLRAALRPQPTIDLVSGTGIRLGIYDIVGDQMRLAISLPSGARPSSLGDASVYHADRSARVP